ncbi:MAG: DUF5317 domain-containing protein [Chloroflexi bacterium]|nr:DUF5317 domain-containing protein [Anaerolineaceae bacterium]NMB89909.1 DUF5317 domain-containing protein [Chloroflexota bacterium]
MIILIAVVLGLAAGRIRSQWGKRRYQTLNLKLEWLVIVAVIPQLIAFQLPGSGPMISDTWARVILVGSQALLILFAWVNRQQPGFWALGAGLGLNFLVIVLNGGFMPISPDTILHLVPNAGADFFQIGHRLGDSKDIVLTVEQTRLWWLSDRLSLPEWLPYKVAFSMGDLVVAFGAFLLLWSLGGPSLPQKESES